jgi:hypothetical protein
MHHVRLQLPQMTGERPQREKIKPGINLTAHLVHHDYLKAALSRTLNKLALAPDRRTSDQDYLVVGIEMLPLAGEQRILLRAAEDHACDDVDNLQIGSDLVVFKSCLSSFFILHQVLLL